MLQCTQVAPPARLARGQQGGGGGATFWTGLNAAGFRLALSRGGAVNTAPMSILCGHFARSAYQRHRLPHPAGPTIEPDKQMPCVRTCAQARSSESLQYSHSLPCRAFRAATTRHTCGRLVATVAAAAANTSAGRSGRAHGGTTLEYTRSTQNSVFARSAVPCHDNSACFKLSHGLAFTIGASPACNTARMAWHAYREQQARPSTAAQCKCAEHCRALSCEPQPQRTGRDRTSGQRGVGAQHAVATTVA
jgi:hypothetical protein